MFVFQPFRGSSENGCCQDADVALADVQLRPDDEDTGCGKSVALTRHDRNVAALAAALVIGDKGLIVRILVRWRQAGLCSPGVREVADIVGLLKVCQYRSLTEGDVEDSSPCCG